MALYYTVSEIQRDLVEKRQVLGVNLYPLYSMLLMRLKIF